MEQMDLFTDAERQIIQYLLSHPEDILSLSVRDLAKNSYTSSSTVNRLASKLSGGMPFTHFKAALFAELHQNTSPLPENLDEITMNETVYSLIGKVAAAQIDAIERTRRALEYPSLLRAARLLQQACQIYFFGFDDNLSIVKPYLNRMMTFGKQIISHDATNAQYYQALIIPEQPEGVAQSPAALLISRTGNNRKLIEIASILKDKKIPILLLTPSKESPLGKYATEWIEIQNGILFETIGTILFDTSIQFILTMLCSLMFSNNYEVSRNILHQYGKLYLQEHPEDPRSILVTSTKDTSSTT